MTLLQTGAPVPTLPGLYVDVVPPAVNFLSPAPTNIMGVVGSATWGPVNGPSPAASFADAVRKFGNPQNRIYDLVTPIYAASLQGAQSFVCVRVTDGTDEAAAGYLGMTATPTKVSGGTGFAVGDTVSFSNGAVLSVASLSTSAIATWTVTTQPTQETTGTLDQTATSGSGTGAEFSFTYSVGVSFASIYTGSGANGDSLTVAPGSKVGTWKATLWHALTSTTETFDNIGFGLSANALWSAIAAAINFGNATRGGSRLMVATAGASTAAPTAQTVVLTGGLDGAASVAASALLGSDTTPRTGMYALRKQNCSVAMLADCSTPSSWPTQVAFGLSDGVYMIGVTATGDTISDAVTNLQSNGVDSYGLKLMFGDWCYTLDPISGVTRVVSPQGFVAGWLAANGPQFSSLNQRLNGIIGTQKSASNTVYYDDDLQTLENAGIDVITNPSPGGAYYSCRIGHNTSSNSAIHGDNYTRTTNFIAATIAAGMGSYIGQLQSPAVQAAAKAELTAYFNDLWAQGAIGASSASQVPFAVTIQNNAGQVAQGLMVASCAVTYLSVVEAFQINIEGGQTVVIASGAPQTTPPLPA